MDELKKQKTLLVGLAVLALGAGSYFVFVSGSGEGAKPVHARGGPALIERPSSTQKAEASLNRRGHGSRSASNVRPPKPRGPSGRGVKSLKDRSGRKQTQVKKREEKPAA